MSAQTLSSLETALRRDLTLVGYPTGEWVPMKTHKGAPVLDVLIVGGGQGGIAIAANLLRERVTNILVVDDQKPGQEGIWRRYARMKTLRTAKNVSGPDLGLPNLTFQAWYEAQFGSDAFEQLGKIDKGDWQDYLGWVSRMLALPIRNTIRFAGVVQEGELLAVQLVENDTARTVFTRKLVLAMGIETSGKWWMPKEIEALPAHMRAHTADDIDFAALAGRKIVVIGAGASAFDNAATALEAGAAQVTLLCRRPEIQSIQPYKIIAHPGFLGHFGSLPDSERWRIAGHLLTIREAFPKETWDRATRHANFEILTGAGISSARMEDRQAIITTPRGDVHGDFVIAGTGFDIDLTLRPELANVAEHVMTWGDAYQPPADQQNARMAKFPYLDPNMAFVPKATGADWIRNIYCFNFGSTASFGPAGSSISAMKFAAPRVASGIVRDLFAADIDMHADILMRYDTPEFDGVLARDRK